MLIYRPNLINYPSLGLVLGMVAMPLFVFLPTYYQKTFGLSFTEIGLIILLSKLVDIITDPIFGFLSDRIKPVISEKKQILIGIVILNIGLYQLLFPETVTFFSLLLWLSITFIGWTIIQIPYYAMLSNYRFESYERLNLNSAREVATTLGLLVAVSLPVIFTVSIESPHYLTLYFGSIAISSLIGLALVSTIKSPTETPLPPSTPTPQKPPSSNLFQDIKNLRPAFRIIPIYFLNNLATALPAVLFIIFVTDYLALSDDKEQFLLFYFVSGILAIPIWLRLQRTLGEIKTWQFSILLASIAFSAVIWLPEIHYTGFLLICVITGLSLIIDIAIPSSLQTKIANEYELKKVNISGLLFGVFGSVNKLTIALAAVIALPLYDTFKDSSYQDLTLLLLYSALPILLKLISYWLLRNPKLN